MSMGDQTTAAPEDEPRELPPRTKRKWAVVLLAAAGLSAAFILQPHLPRDRQIDLQVNEPFTLTGVDLTWFPSPGASRDDTRIEEPLRAASFRFSPGAAPQNIKYIVRLPDGSYRVDLVVRRGEHAESVQRTVTLDDADRITLPLR